MSEKKVQLFDKAEEIESKAGDLRAMLQTLGAYVEGSGGIEAGDEFGLAYLLQLLSEEADHVSILGDELRSDLHDEAKEQERGAQ